MYNDPVSRIKPNGFRGGALADLREFPAPARREAGFQLDRLQRGEKAADWKPMKTIGSATRENRIKDAAGDFRVVDVATFSDTIYVLHCFQKKSQATSRSDLDTATRRYRDLAREVEQ